jgi:hypothetical protein
MKKLMFMAVLALVLLPAMRNSATAQGAGISGDWVLTINSPQGSRDVNASFKQDGEKLSGAFKSSRGELPFQGTVNGKQITFSYPYKTPDIDIAITMTGELEGDSLKGKADFGGLAEGDWSGKRGSMSEAASPAAAQQSSDKVDVTGTWNFEVETSQGTGNPTFTFKQEGEKLTGQYKGAFGEAPLTGTVRGNAIEFSFKVTGQIEATITYKGTMDKSSGKGTVTIPEIGSGTWTAKRQ